MPQSLTELKLRKLITLRALMVEQAERDRTAHTEAMARYRTDPVSWVVDRLGEEVWSKQAEIMAALATHRKVAVRSAHGTGKSHIASRLVAHWLDVHPTDDAFVVTTAPTFPQVRAVLWRYIRQVHKKGKLAGRVNQTEWLVGDDLVAYGRKPADHDAAGFQGIHAAHVLVVVDEAGGIPESLWYAIDSLTVNRGCAILAIGNPDDPTAYFKKINDPGSGWHVIRISAFDSPNLTGETVSERISQSLISAEWVAEKAAEWGEDNPVYVSKVLGEFPTQDPHAVVRIEDVTRCRLLDTPRDPTELLPVELGVDVGGGGDLTVIRERRGPVAGRQWTSNSDRPEELAPLVVRAILDTGATRVKIDSIGIGWGLIGELRNRAARLEHAAEVVAVNVAEKASDPTKYYNLRSEIWWHARERSAARVWDLGSMAEADQTVAELVEPRWTLDGAGRIRVESKDDIRARAHGRSPDHADALLLAFHQQAHSLQDFFDKLPGVAGVRSN